MLVDFDKFGMAERPVLTLAYPQGKELGQLGSYKGLTYDPVLTSYATINFQYSYYGAEGAISHLYNDISSWMLIKVEGVGEFIITSCEEHETGAERYLDITASTSEVQMCHRKINLLNGTYKFYDLLNPEETLLGKIVKYIPTWKIGYVSTELMSKYRTFDIPDSTLYDFMMNSVSQTYECIFRFDNVNRVINAYSIDEATKNSDVFIGYGNFLKSEKIEEVSDELTNVMSCYGGDGVNIASVNPLGSVYLYDFSHFKHMMSDSLKGALEKWETLYEVQRENYSKLLTELKEVNGRLITAQANLRDAESEKAAVEGVQSAQIAGGLADTGEYQTTLSKLNAVNILVAKYSAEIETIEAEKNAIAAEQKKINDSLKFDTTTGIFTEEDLLELEHFKFESTHQDDNFIITDIMSIVEQQEMMEQLYQQCESLIKQVSHPTYRITADAVNFLFVEKLATYINKIYDPDKPGAIDQLLGVKFNLEIAPDEWIEPVLIKLHINFDDPTDFSMEFSNRYRLNDALWTYSELVGDSVSATGNISFDYSALKTWETHRNELVDFANGSLDATKNKLVNSSEDYTFLIDHTGLRGHSVKSDGTPTGRGIWLTADTLAFSDDNFNTVKTAVGLIPIGNSYKYGINGEVLIGKMIFGSELTIANENNTMKMDGNGLIVETSTNRIMLNPDDGILIQKKSGNSYTNQLYADSAGNLVLAGGVTATEGSIGGFNITSNSISSPDGNIKLNADGTATIGMMTVGTSSTTFNGKIYASNIQYGTVGGYLDGGAISSGTITSAELGSGAVTSGKISSGAVTDAAIASGTITSGSLNVSNIASSGSTFRNQFDSIYATEARVNTLIANSAYIKWLQGEPTYEGSYYNVNVNGSLTASVSLVANGVYANSNLRSYGTLQVDGASTLSGNVTIGGYARVTGALQIYRSSAWKTVMVAGTAGSVPSGAKVLYVT
ncbi:MAG: hypothetical protein ACI4IW_05490 [Oscillospiraceae bacterium]